MKESLRAEVRRFALAAHGAGIDESGNVFSYGRPPELTLDELQGATYARVTGEARGVPPQKDLSPHCLGDKQPIGRTSFRVRFNSLSSSHGILNLPRDRSHDLSSRKDRHVRVISNGRSVDSGQGIRFEILRPGPIGEDKLESIEEKRPSSLSRVQPLRLLDILQIFVGVSRCEKKAHG